MQERENSMSQYEYDVFISYAHANAQYATKLRKSFDKLGIKVFRDVENIDWGDKWEEVIENALKKCRFGVVIISEDFYNRDWTEKELKTLLVHQTVLPILYNTDFNGFKAHCKKSCYKKLEKIQFISSSKYDVKDITILLAYKLLHDKANNSNDSSKLSNTEIFDEFFKDSCYALNLWLDGLINNNNDWMANDEWNNVIGWHILNVNGTTIELIQERSNQRGREYHINPIYFKDFCDYFNKKIKPQL